jgi:PadR family transcriptional regulator, regulatory protein PadR
VICTRIDILYPCTTQIHKEKAKEKMPNYKRDTESKLVKGLLDFIILQLLNTQPMHGYQIITQIRKSFGVYFGPSTIYPLLATLEKKSCIISEWNLDTQRPRKMYNITKDGQSQLTNTENSLMSICRRITPTTITDDMPDLTIKQPGTQLKEV